MSVIQYYRSTGLSKPKPFVTIWKTDNPGVSISNQIRLPLVAIGNYKFSVDWGDGQTDLITSGTQAEITHTYATPGVKTVTATGLINGFRFNNGGDRLKILNVLQWGDLRLSTPGGSYFYGCSNLDVSATDIPDFRITDYAGFFRGTSSLVFNESINRWPMSQAVTIASMFNGSSFNQELNLWQLYSLQSLNGTFTSSTFNKDVSMWYVSNVLDFNSTFRNGSYTHPLATWDIRKGNNFGLFYQNRVISDYSNALVAWSNLPLQPNVTFHGGNSKYSAGAAATARQYIISTYNWTITDGGLAA